MLTSMTRPVKMFLTSTISVVVRIFDGRLAGPASIQMRHDMPTARISDNTTSEIQTIAPVFDSCTQPRNDQPDERREQREQQHHAERPDRAQRVARRNTNQPISSRMPSTASSGVTAGSPPAACARRVAARVVREQHQRERERRTQQETDEGKFLHALSRGLSAARRRVVVLGRRFVFGRVVAGVFAGLDRRVGLRGGGADAIGGEARQHDLVERHAQPLIGA